VRACGKADIGGVAADDRRNIDRGGGSETRSGNDIREEQGQGHAIVGQMSMHRVGTEQKHPGGGHVESRYGRCRAALIEAGGIRTFAGVVVDVEFDRDAGGQPLVAQSAGDATDRIHACRRILHRECKAVGNGAVGSRQSLLEVEIRRERLHIEGSRVPDRVGITALADNAQLQRIIGERRISHETQSGRRREAGGISNDDCRTAGDRISG